MRPGRISVPMSKCQCLCVDPSLRILEMGKKCLGTMCPALPLSTDLAIILKLKSKPFHIQFWVRKELLKRPCPILQYCTNLRPNNFRLQSPNCTVTIVSQSCNEKQLKCTQRIIMMKCTTSISKSFSNNTRSKQVIRPTCGLLSI